MGALKVLGSQTHRGKVMMFNQPAMRNMPKGVRGVRKCQKATKYDTLTPELMSNGVLPHKGDAPYKLTAHYRTILFHLGTHLSALGWEFWNSRMRSSAFSELCVHSR